MHGPAAFAPFPSPIQADTTEHSVSPFHASHHQFEPSEVSSLHLPGVSAGDAASNNPFAAPCDYLRLNACLLYLLHTAWVPPDHNPRSPSGVDTPSLPLWYVLRV